MRPADADPKLKAQDGATLLIAAAGSGHVEVVRYACELSPDIAAAADKGQTALHLAGTAQTANPEEIAP